MSATCLLPALLPEGHNHRHSTLGNILGFPWPPSSRGRALHIATLASPRWYRRCSHTHKKPVCRLLPLASAYLHSGNTASSGPKPTAVLESLRVSYFGLAVFLNLQQIHDSDQRLPTHCKQVAVAASSCAPCPPYLSLTPSISTAAWVPSVFDASTLPEPGPSSCRSSCYPASGLDKRCPGHSLLCSCPIQPYFACRKSHTAAQKEVGVAARWIVDCPSRRFRKVYFRFCICTCHSWLSRLTWSSMQSRAAEQDDRHPPPPSLHRTETFSKLTNRCLSRFTAAIFVSGSCDAMRPVCAAYNLDLALAGLGVDIWSNIVLCGLR